jgi:hypothetical protein
MERSLEARTNNRARASAPGRGLFPRPAKQNQSLLIELKILFDQIEGRLHRFRYARVGVLPCTRQDMVKFVRHYPAERSTESRLPIAGARAA